MPAAAKYRVKPDQVRGFHHNRRTPMVHLAVGEGTVFVTPCGRSVDTLIPLDGFKRLDWKTVCPTCLDGAPGFLPWWRENHQPIPY